jgi:hypothetical protein
MNFLFLNLLFPMLTFFGGQDTGMCNQPNYAYSSGEKIQYTIFYNVLGLYVNAGRADFSIQNTNWNGSDAYTFTALGRSNGKYDWIFKVRDKYESIVDAKTLLPYQFTRQINEGGYHYSETLQFNQKARTVTSSKAPGVFKATDCTYDVVSAIYAARNINYANCQMNDKIYLNFFLEKELYPSYFKYLGKDVMTTRYGKFKVIKLAPLLVKGTIFKDGDKMVVWVTDDENHIPVRIETPIAVGSIKVDMVGYENLRHPLTSLIKLAGEED